MSTFFERIKFMPDYDISTIENNFIYDYPRKPIAVISGYGYRVYAIGYFWQIIQCTGGTWDLILQDNNKGIRSNYYSLQYLCQCGDKRQLIETFCSLSDNQYAEF